jgi:hypothetical protein
MSLIARSSAALVLALLSQAVGCDHGPTVESADGDRAVSQALAAAGELTLKDFGVACPGGVGGDRIVRLSEVMPGPCDDQLELQDIIFDLGQGGKLIVDKVCTLDAGLRLPSRFTLAGVNDGGDGTLVFTHDGTGISVCQEAPRQNVTLQDLAIYGPYSQPGVVSAPHSIGIALANLNLVQIDRVRLTDFHVGLQGTQTFSVEVEHSNISNSRLDNIVVGYDSNGWRIRDGLVSRAGRYGINVLGPGDATPIGTVDTSNDMLIDGVRMESNAHAAVRTAAYATRITNARFEGNGASAGMPFHPAVRVTSAAWGTRVLTNLFNSPSVDCLWNQGTSTLQGFNIPQNIVCQ